MEASWQQQEKSESNELPTMYRVEIIQEMKNGNEKMGKEVLRNERYIKHSEGYLIYI